MKKLLSYSLFLFILFYALPSTWAAYITDSFKVNFRTGPGNQYRIVAMVSSGTKAQILRKDGKWTQIQLPNGKQGWVLSQYLVDRVPWEVKAKTLEEEKAAIENRYANFSENWDNLTSQKGELEKNFKETSKALKELRIKHENLRKGSTNYLNLKQDYDIVKSALAEELKKNKTLEQENLELRSSERIKWIALGALILFSGFVIGVFVGRGRKKPRQSLHI